MEIGIQNSVEQNPLFIDQVYERLLESISLGELKAGVRVRQSVLADRLGVSRQPVSHALQMLKQQGLVRDAGKQGVEVSPVDPNYVVQLYQARTALEAVATSQAAARVRDGLVSDAEMEALDTALQAGLAAIAEGVSLPGMVRADSRFHFALYRLAANPAIEQMMAGQWPHLMRSMLHVLDDPGTPTRAWKEHAALTRSVLAGNADDAVEQMTQHLVRAGSDLHARLTLPDR